MNLKEYRPVVEALLFASGEPVTAEKLGEAIPLQTYLVEDLLRQMKEEYDRPESGLQLLQLEDRWQLATKDQFAQPIKTLLDKKKNTPLSQAAMEVLAIIAYNQPVSRSFIEQVRGIDSSTLVTRLAERGLVEEAGRLDLPGRPIAFKTTDTFLRTFGIENISQLPRLHEDFMEEDPQEEGPVQTSMTDQPVTGEE